MVFGVEILTFFQLLQHLTTPYKFVNHYDYSFFNLDT